jgi:hypothetical protein
MIPVQDNPNVGEAAGTSHYRPFIPLMVAARQHVAAVVGPELCYHRLSAKCWCRVGLADGGKAMSTIHLSVVRPKDLAWNEVRIIGQKRPLQPKHVWAIRVRLEIA